MGEEFRRILKETNAQNYKESVESFLAATADDLEPKTHCCECTPGSYFEKHLVHIQYPKCDCLSKDYILKTNSELKNEKIDQTPRGPWEFEDDGD